MEALVGSSTERRRSARRWLGIEERGFAQVRIRSGRSATVLNISSGGALIESESRLPPGTMIELIFERPDGQIVVKGRVLRSAVTRVLVNRVAYQIAMAFDRGVTSAPGSDAGYRIPHPRSRTTVLFRADATQAVDSPGSDRVG